jgi:hypothetical protein
VESSATNAGEQSVLDPWPQQAAITGRRQPMDPDDFDSDPISESNDLKDAGDHSGARRLLMELCQADLRCLDAHAHFGNLAFDH